MGRDDVEDAIAEAKRFIVRAEVLLASTPSTYQRDGRYREEPWNGNGAPKLSGAVRRASLDLTRALAHMRRRGE